MPATIRYEPDPTDLDRVLMTETWRLDDPDCPFVVIKFVEVCTEPGHEAETFSYRHSVSRFHPDVVIPNV